MQSAHVLADFAFKFRGEFESWRNGSNYLCCLEIDDLTITDKLDVLGIKYCIFFEDDIQEYTAIAVEAISREQHRKLFGKLKLTYHESYS